MEKEHPSRIWWIIKPRAGSRGKRVFLLRNGIPEKALPLEISMDGQGLEISSGNSRVLRYQYNPMPPPEGADSLYTRSGFIHPIWSPRGRVLTRIHPPDHIHHMGFWTPWTRTEFQGRSVDFWNLGDGTGTVRFVRFTSKESGPVFARFQAVHEHVDLTAPGGETVVLDEVWDVWVWNTGKAEQRRWIWDFLTSQACAGKEPLKLLKYRYGGFGFRGSAEWNEKNSDYLTSGRKTRKNGNGTRARWCRVFGRFRQGQAGIAFLSHPENHQHPEPLRIWPSGDVFFGFCPVVNEEWILESGQDYVRRYRVLVYDGKMGVDDIENYWRMFARSPKIDIEMISP
jgi:hypothetical protein